MESTSSKILAGIFAISSIIGIGWALNFNGLALKSYFAPKSVAIDNAVFHESQQYNDGMVRDLENLQMEYFNADADHKQAIKAIVLHRFSVYPEDKLPANLRNFYEQLKGNR